LAKKEKTVSPPCKNRTNTVVLAKKEKTVSPPCKNRTNTVVLAKKEKTVPPRCRPPVKQSYSAFFREIGLDGANLDF